MEGGEALKQMADLKYALDDNVKQNYLEPLHQLQSKDLKEVAHHRKKLQGRKLDYDCKKRQQQSKGQVPDKEIKQVAILVITTLVMVMEIIFYVS